MSAKALTSLVTKRLPDGRRELLEDLVVEVDGVKLTVPAGTVTDYSSIPQPFAWLMRWSRVDIAGVVHDWLYQTGMLLRGHADRVWFELAIAGEHRANVAQGFLGWLGLRFGGWLAWRRHRAKDGAS